MQQKTRISYNPFARLDPVRHWTERWQRRQFSRIMAIIVGLLALFSFLSQAANGQNFEYGDPGELKGLTRYWVETGGDLKARNKIIMIVRKDLPTLELVDEVTDAQIRLGYVGVLKDTIVGGETNGGQATVKNARLPVGTGTVWLDARGQDKSKFRIVLNFSSRQDHTLEKMPFEKFAREFVKTYKKANGLK